MGNVQLSASSIILATILSGCSQNQITDNNQLSSKAASNPSQMDLSQEIAELKKPESMSPDSFYESAAHRKERLSRLKLVISKQRQISYARLKKIPAAKPVKFKKVVYKAAAPKVKRVVQGKPHPTQTIQRLSFERTQTGQCRTKVKLPAKYVTKRKRVFIQKASTKRILIRAPQYRWEKKKVLVRKATYETNIVPEKYKTAKKRVLLRPSKVVRTFVPARYKTVKQKVLIAPAVYRTVKIPARYKMQNYRQKIASARYVWRSNLCQMKEAKQKDKLVEQKDHRLIQLAMDKAFVRATDKNGYKLDPTRVQPIRVINIQHDKKVVTPQVSSMTNEKLSDALLLLSKVTLKKKTNALKKKNKSKKRLSRAEKKRHIVMRIQKSLKSKGFNTGGVDGKLGVKTAAALKEFQSLNGLEVGKLDKNTLQALGIVRS